MFFYFVINHILLSEANNINYSVIDVLDTII
jgi:hypothetical protein